jgi:hypothetical protein
VLGVCLERRRRSKRRGRKRRRRRRMTGLETDTHDKQLLAPVAGTQQCQSLLNAVHTHTIHTHIYLLYIRILHYLLKNMKSACA